MLVPKFVALNARLVVVIRVVSPAATIHPAVLATEAVSMTVCQVVEDVLGIVQQAVLRFAGVVRMFATIVVMRQVDQLMRSLH